MADRRKRDRRAGESSCTENVARKCELQRWTTTAVSPAADTVGSDANARLPVLPETARKTGELLNREDVGIDRGLRVVAPLKFFQHALPKSSHRNLLPMTDKAIAAASFSLRDTPSAAKRLRCVLGIAQQLGGESPLPTRSSLGT